MKLISRTAAVLMLVVVSVLPVQSAAAEEFFTVYMSATGADTNDGLTPTTEVKTLTRVEAILTAAAPTTDVQVRIRQGTYVAPETTWRFYIPGHSIMFMPIDWNGGGIGSIAGMPVFTGNGAASYWLKLRLPSGDPGGTMNINFRYLQVERYAFGGVNINGGYTTNAAGIRVPVGAGHNGNSFMGMYFRLMGSKHNAGGTGYGAIVLSNSSNNSIRNSRFYNLENNSPNQGIIHGLYIEHGSHDNRVTTSRFTWISGDPAHTRNGAAHNTWDGNRFERTGTTTAYYGEWFCDGTCVSPPTSPRECASPGNQFINNDVVNGYNGGTIPLWHLAPPGNTYPGGAGCPALTEPRIATSGNF